MDKEGRGEKWLLPAGLKMFQKERKKKIADGIFMAVFLETDVFFTEVQEKKDFTHCTALFPFPLDGLWQELRRRLSFLMSRRSKSDGPS